MSRIGLTLIELLLSVSLLALVAVGGAAWIKLAMRGTEFLDREIGQIVTRSSAIRLMRDDIRMAKSVDLEEGELKLVTFHRLEGDGMTDVVWNWNEGELWRQEAQDNRQVASGLDLTSVEIDEDSNCWWYRGKVDTVVPDRFLIWSGAW